MSVASIATADTSFSNNALRALGCLSFANPVFPQWLRGCGFGDAGDVLPSLIDIVIALVALVAAGHMALGLVLLLTSGLAAALLLVVAIADCLVRATRGS